MADIITSKINLFEGVINAALRGGDKEAVRGANKRIRQLRKDLRIERKRIARAA